MMLGRNECVLVCTFEYLIFVCGMGMVHVVLAGMGRAEMGAEMILEIYAHMHASGVPCCPHPGRRLPPHGPHLRRQLEFIVIATNIIYYFA